MQNAVDMLKKSIAEKFGQCIDLCECLYSNKRTNRYYMKHNWSRTGKVLKNLGFLIPLSSVLTWFLPIDMILRAMAIIYISSIYLVYSAQASKHRHSYLQDNTCTWYLKAFLIVHKISPLIKAGITGMLFFNLMMYMITSILHDTSLPIGYALIKFTNLSSITKIIALLGVGISIGKTWQKQSDERLKKIARSKDLYTLNKQATSHLKLKSCIRALAEWILVTHNTFFITSSACSIIAMYYNIFSRIQSSLIGLFSTYCAYKVGQASKKASKAYMPNKLARLSHSHWCREEKQFEDIQSNRERSALLH